MKSTLLLVVLIITMVMGFASMEAKAKETTTSPSIIVQTPQRWQGVGHRFILAGRARTFEGQVNWRIKNRAGARVSSGYTTATCGSGCWGRFSTRASIPARYRGGYYTLQVYEVSAENGMPLHMVSIPIRVY